MPLVTSEKMLLDAKKDGYAVGAFNVENMEMVKAVISCGGGAERTGDASDNTFYCKVRNIGDICRNRESRSRENKDPGMSASGSWQ